MEINRQVFAYLDKAALLDNEVCHVSCVFVMTAAICIITVFLCCLFKVILMMDKIMMMGFEMKALGWTFS